MRDLFRGALLSALLLALNIGGATVWAQEGGGALRTDGPMGPSDSRWHLQQLVSHADETEIVWAFEGARNYLQRYEREQQELRSLERKLKASEHLQQLVTPDSQSRDGQSEARGESGSDTRGPTSVASEFGTFTTFLHIACMVVSDSLADWDNYCHSGATTADGQVMCDDNEDEVAADQLWVDSWCQY